MQSDPNTFYYGYEVGPIRPPSEARSLLLRVTRNCPWNRCAFCSIYKQSEFSERVVAHIKQDIDSIARHIESLVNPFLGRIMTGKRRHEPAGTQAYWMAFNWFRHGMKAVFIQDADSLSMPASDIIEILTYLHDKFPSIERVTSYARSSTVAKISKDSLKAMREAGLNRIHIGMESGSDAVLKMVKKGASKEIHVKAGLKVRAAGIELSEYVMPGLGGIRLSREHALETASALNRINPDFIRFRQLAIPVTAPLHATLEAGRFERCTDLQVMHELRLLISNLDGIKSSIVSDHILNLLQEVEGGLPEDKTRLLSIIDEFLEMNPQRQRLFQLGRRLGLFYGLGDLKDDGKMARVEAAYQALGISPENIDEKVSDLMTRFI
ncbi:MAG: radical SAM protein [Candidatus Thorarchaeota archaeon]|nr:radical SAM protein [Candidatus Thorarchaeota archaeon]